MPHTSSSAQQVCSDTMSFDLPAAALAGAIEELGIAAEIAANKGDAPVNIYNELGEQGEQCWHAVWPLVSTAGMQCAGWGSWGCERSASLRVQAAARGSTCVCS